MPQPFANETIEAESVVTHALPPPSEDNKKPRRIRLQSFFCILCAFFAISVLLLCALQKLDEALSKGFWETISEVMLTNGSLGDSVGEAAFGRQENEIAVTVPTSNSLLTLPRIYYIPKEKIIDTTVAEAKELEKKVLELYSFDYSKVPSDAYPIIPTDLAAADALSVKNDTTLEVDMNEIAKAAALREPEAITSEPLVLIVHTHGTESFSAEDSICYNEDFNNPRSEDVSKNIVAVGKTLAEALNKKGIPTIHCEIMHDKESYIDAYDRSAESIAEYIERFPSIRYVFDVHRDSLIRTDLTKLRPVTIHNGEACAQLMMIAGSNEKSGIGYDWQANLILAEAIQENLVNDTLGVARQLYLRGATYNQQYAKYGLLLEIGSCGNTLSEAKNAALAFADAFEKVLKGE